MAPSLYSIGAVLCLLPSALGASSLLVSHYTGNIYTLTLSDSGALSLTSTIRSGNSMPAWLTFDSESKTLYVPDEASFGRPVLTTFKVASDGKLTASTALQTLGGELHSTLYGGANGKSFYATAVYDGSAITNYKLPLTTSTQAIQRLKYTMNGSGPVPSRQNAPHPHSVFTDPSGKFLLSADLGADVVRIYSIDNNSGSLTMCGSGQAGAGDGPRHGAFWSPADAKDTSLTMLYTVNELSNSVSAWSVGYSGSCMTLTRKQTLSSFPAGKTPPQGSKASEVHVKGNFVYVANRWDQSFGTEQDAVAIYSINPATGAITYLERANTRTYFPRTFAINNAGTLVAFGGQTSSNVAILERNTTTGLLGKLVANLVVGSRGRAGQEDGLSAVIWNE